MLFLIDPEVNLEVSDGMSDADAIRFAYDHPNRCVDPFEADMIVYDITEMAYAGEWDDESYDWDEDEDLEEIEEWDGLYEDDWDCDDLD